MTDNSKLPQKTILLKDYDYSTTGAYLVTVCTKNKKPILCRIVGTDADGAVPTKNLVSNFVGTFKRFCNR